MNFFIEGGRNVGKTYLIENALKDNSLNLKYYKFPFYKISQEMFADANGISIGKDLALLEMINQLDFSQNLIIDRGFLSTLIYNQVYRNFSPENNIKILDYINQNFKKKIVLIYIEADEESRSAHNIEKVREKDNKILDLYKIEEIKSIYRLYLKILQTFQNIEVVRYINRFDEDSVNNFKKLIRSEL